MPGEDKNFGGSLVLDFRKWWRHVKTIYMYYSHTKLLSVAMNEERWFFLSLLVSIED